MIKTFVIISLFILFAGCRKDSTSVNVKKETEQKTNTVTESKTVEEIYKSNDGMMTFKVVSRTSDGNGSLRLLDQSSDKIYDLKRVESGSGEKYQSSDGYVFWLKGNEFMWGTANKDITNGTILQSAGSNSNTAGGSDFNPNNFGSYVDDSYKDRSSGADWVSVTVLPLTRQRMNVSVRSRADKMNPTCTYDGIATVISANELTVSDNLGTLVLKFSGISLTVSAGEGSQEAMLTYYCRGGGSLAGTYQKINEQLDQKQVDKTSYAKTLSMKGSDIEFYIEVKGNKLTISPAGLINDNKPVIHNIEGYVSDAEIGDLNADGSPEIYIYTVSEGTGRFGDVIAYSVNNGKSMTQINLPKISENKEASEGYGGHDEFAIVENSLVRRFPVYKPDDANSNPTGGTKQIQYKLIPGEAMWQLEIDKVVSY